MITRPPLGASAGILAALAFVGALSVTPIVSSHDRPPGAAIRFWWARLAPLSYALDALGVAGVVSIVDDSLYCPDPESLAQASRTIAADPRADSLFRHLFARPNPAARVYALVGLLYVKSAAAPRALALSRCDTSQVRVFVWSTSGLRATTASVGQLVLNRLPDVWVKGLGRPSSRRCAA